MTPSPPTGARSEPAPPLPPDCREGDPVAVGRSVVDSALGRRYLRIDVRNCTSRAVTLERPVLAGVTAAGRGGVLRLAATPVAGRPDQPFVLAAGATASAGVEWHAAPRTRRVDELRVTTAAPGDVPDRLSFDVLDMRLGSRLDYYPWVSKPDDVF